MRPIWVAELAVWGGKRFEHINDHRLEKFLKTEKVNNRD